MMGRRSQTCMLGEDLEQRVKSSGVKKAQRAKDEAERNRRYFALLAELAKKRAEEAANRRWILTPEPR